MSELLSLVRDSQSHRQLGPFFSFAGALASYNGSTLPVASAKLQNSVKSKEQLFETGEKKENVTS